MAHGKDLSDIRSQVVHVKIRPAEAAVQEARHDIKEGQLDGHDVVRAARSKEDHDACHSKDEGRDEQEKRDQRAFHGHIEGIMEKNEGNAERNDGQHRDEQGFRP